MAASDDALARGGGLWLAMEGRCLFLRIMLQMPFNSSFLRQITERISTLWTRPRHVKLPSSYLLWLRSAPLLELSKTIAHGLQRCYLPRNSEWLLVDFTFVWMMGRMANALISRDNSTNQSNFQGWVTACVATTSPVEPGQICPGKCIRAWKSILNTNPNSATNDKSAAESCFLFRLSFWYCFLQCSFPFTLNLTDIFRNYYM